MQNRGRSERDFAVVLDHSDTNVSVLDLQIHPQMFRLTCLNRSCSQRKETPKSKQQRRKGALTTTFSGKGGDCEGGLWVHISHVQQKNRNNPLPPYSPCNFLLDTCGSGFIFLPEYVFSYSQNLILSYIV